MQVDIIVRNLLSNACKFSRKGSEVVLEINSDRHKIDITVTDEGIGINEDELSKLLEPFY